MTGRTRLPPALEPYLRLPPETSLILLTGTLGCAVHWVTARFVGSFLAPLRGAESAAGVGPGAGVRSGAGVRGSGYGFGDGDGKRGEEEGQEGQEEEEEQETAVILASWLRGEKFWATEIRRTCGLDTPKLTTANRYLHLDFLRNPCSLADLESTVSQAVTKLSPPEAPRAPGQKNTSKKKKKKKRKIVLILDNPDLLLALTACSAQDLYTTLLRLRSQTYAMVVSCAGDAPLLGAAAAAAAVSGDAASALQTTTTTTPLEAESAGFVVQMVYAARFVIGVRGLETGSARDVSGVLRVTRGGGVHDDQKEEEEEEGEEEDEWGRGSRGKGKGEEVKEMEALFLVGRDGGARVFERGAVG